MMLSLFLTMMILFLIGTHLPWTVADPQKQDQTPKVVDLHSSAQPSISPSLPDIIKRLKRPDPDEILKIIQLEHMQLPNFPQNGRSPLSSIKSSPKATVDPWKVWGRWVSEDYFYPEGAFNSSEMNSILQALAMSQITEFGLGYKGTQLKTTMMLGHQRTVFKPKRYV